MSVAILGASGYTARELFRLLLAHPRADAVLATSRSPDGQSVGDVHPSLRGRVDLALSNPTPEEIAGAADVAFCCLPHAASAAVVRKLVDLGVKVVDLSADYRLGDAATYQRWYGVAHPDAQALGGVPYGLPELFREQIRGATLVANPGCYPTATVLALAPLLRAGLIEREGLVIDAKSGVSGAGRTPSEATHFVEANESVTPYKIGSHRHTPEIERVLGMATGASDIRVVFTPHLVPMSRGLCATCYARAAGDADTQALADALHAAYQNEPFVRVIGTPRTADVVNTNFCDVGVHRVGDTVVAIGAIDNLVKGASGAAIQNMNLMLGFDETLGLIT